jgi:hypothetical protein
LGPAAITGSVLDPQRDGLLAVIADEPDVTLEALSRRLAAECAVEAINQRIARLLDAFSPKECANSFRNAGYAST